MMMGLWRREGWRWGAIVGATACCKELEDSVSNA